MLVIEDALTAFIADWTDFELTDVMSVICDREADGEIEDTAALDIDLEAVERPEERTEDAGEIEAVLAREPEEVRDGADFETETDFDFVEENASGWDLVDATAPDTVFELFELLFFRSCEDVLMLFELNSDLTSFFEVCFSLEVEECAGSFVLDFFGGADLEDFNVVPLDFEDFEVSFGCPFDPPKRPKSPLFCFSFLFWSCFSFLLWSCFSFSFLSSCSFFGSFLPLEEPPNRPKRPSD